MMKDFRNIKSILILLLGMFPVTLLACNKSCPDHVHNIFKVNCDICSCSTSSGSFGFGTLSNSNFVGVRYIYQEFESRNGIFIDSPISKETFNTYQLWAQLPIKESFYVTLSLPYNSLSRTLEGNTEGLDGLGDGNIIGWYKHKFYKKKEDKDGVDYDANGMNMEESGHAIQFGIGAKLPTGKFEQSLAGAVNPAFQLGTGSVDGIFSIGYTYSKSKIGVNTLLNYYLKGENKNNYKFGNQFSYSSSFYRIFSTPKANIMPFIGVSGDVYDTIEQYNEDLKGTNGNIFNGSLGSEVAIKKFIFGANYTLPITQNMFDDTVKSKQRFSLYVNMAL